MKVRCIKFGYPNNFNYQPEGCPIIHVGFDYYADMPSIDGFSNKKIIRIGGTRGLWYDAALFIPVSEVTPDTIVLSKESINEFLNSSTFSPMEIAAAMNLLNRCGVNVKRETKTTYKVE